VDLGLQPGVGRFPLPEEPPASALPLRLGICASCGLAQLADSSPPEPDEPDAPSPLSSSTMSAHARGLVDGLIERGLVGPASRTLSVASHGGHLQPFLAERGIGAVALEASPTRAGRLAEDGLEVVQGELDGPDPPALPSGSFDAVVDSYLLAHLERPRAGLRRLAGLLAPGGVLVLEFDHLLATVEGGQWDSIRHGHRAYLALGWVLPELEAVGLDVLDVEVQPVYGGVLRVLARAAGHAGPVPGQVAAVLARERAAAVDRPAGLAPLGAAVAAARAEVAPHLRAARAAGRRVAGYGAPARGITFLNALGIGPDLLPYVVDRAPSKQGRVMPGVGIPIRSPETLLAERPDEILVLTWDLAPEVRRALDVPVLASTTFFVAVPRLRRLPGMDGEAPAPAARGGMR